MEKRTPLYDEHVKAGGKIVEYAGWDLPVEYTALVEEHEAVRTKVGMFDVSHMGEITVKGPDAAKFVDYLVTNDVKTLENGKIVYCFMCYEDGGVVDDLLVYKSSEEDLLLVVNASNIDKDFEWVKSQKGSFNVELKDISDSVGEVAVQGPMAEKTLQKIADVDLSEIKFFSFKKGVKIAGVDCLVSRTGYTGEDGFEVYTKWGDIVAVWKAVIDAGKEFGLLPCGLGCRDTLRFEAGLALYGHEISKDITPLEAGFKFAVALGKDSDFIGKAALQKMQDAGVPRTLIGLELTERGIARDGAVIFKDGVEIGYITTGYMSPTLKKAIGNALVKTEEAVRDAEVEVQVRKRMIKAKFISKRYLTKHTKSK